MNNVGASDLGLNLKPMNEKSLFEWFLAAYLFGKPIQQSVARRTWDVFMDYGLTSPRKIVAKTWQQLVDILGEGHYRRYDEATARNLLAVSRTLIDNHEGQISNLLETSSNRQDLAKQLETLQGVGPKTTEIFLSQLPAGYLQKTAG